MRVKRSTLIDGSRRQYFHVTSRVVDRRYIFGEEEKSHFLGLLRKYEAFTGVRVVAYCLMSNHIHMLVCIPRRPEEISEEELLTRMKHIYSRDKMSAIRSQLSEFEESGQLARKKQFFDGIRSRIYDLSSFVRELKLSFSKDYNRKKERKGTLWEERFKATLVEGSSNALMNTAAYIELNPVRAGIVDDPADYRWCSYHAAVAGDSRSREGISELVSGMGPELNYRESIGPYRFFFVERSVHQDGSRKGMGSEALEKARSTKSQLSKTGEPGMRVRNFVDGLVIGSREYIEAFYEKRKELLNPARKKTCYRIPGTSENELHSYRKVEI